MKMRKVLSGLLALVCILILIFDSNTAMQGAREGVSLCIQTVIPSLFPFLFLAEQITVICMGRPIRVLRPLSRFMGIPEGTESILVNAFLGGYPSGALCVAEYHKQGYYSDDSAARLLPLCNHAGPAFIFGLAAVMFSRKSSGWVLWLIQIISAIVISAFFRPNTPSISVSIQSTNASDSGKLIKTLRAMAQICGWIILFRILITYEEKWFLDQKDTPLRVIISGLTELTNGCCMLNLIDDEKLRLIICSGLLSAGGLCVLLQTRTVSAPVSFRHYFPAKLLQCGFAVVYAYIYTCDDILLTASAIAFTLMILFFSKKHMVIRKKIMYNAFTISGGSVYALSKKN